MEFFSKRFKITNPKYKIIAFVFFEIIVALLMIKAISDPDAPVCMGPRSYAGECPPEKIVGTASTLLIPFSILFIAVLIVGIFEIRKII